MAKSNGDQGGPVRGHAVGQQESESSERRQTKKVKTSALRAVKHSSWTTRLYAPAKIADSSEDDFEYIAPPAPVLAARAKQRSEHQSEAQTPMTVTGRRHPDSSTRLTSTISSECIKEDLNESGEEGEAELQQEREEDMETREACNDFEAEQVTLMDPELLKDDDTSPSTRGVGACVRNQTITGSRSSSVTSTFASEPLVTDYSDDYALLGTRITESEDESEEPERRGSRKQGKHSLAPHAVMPLVQSSDDEHEVPESRVQPVAQTSRQLMRNQEKKLKDEMLEIHESDMNTSNAAEHADTSGDMVWEPHTDIIVIPGPRSFRIEIKPQNAIMQQVICHSYSIAYQLVIFGWHAKEQVLDMTLTALTSLVTPMQKDGLDIIARMALVEAADMLGYDGEGDIADHLERGTYPDYVKPLVAYASVAHWVSLFRTAVKKSGVTSTVNHEFWLSNAQARAVPDKVDLLKDLNYIYPWHPTVGFDKYAPYKASYIKDALRESFFSSVEYLDVGTLNGELFKSSSVSAPSEHEIPLEMLALCMTAVESVISDSQMKLEKASEFRGTNAPTYHAHLVRLADFHRQKPNWYHRIMHNLFIASTHGRSLAGATLASVEDGGFDWSNIPDE
ncbi:hypothetical protein DAEQUDRAFT_741753 [Daedalea quercina L-15889]|uniref:DUF6532 domain-containing protein n=1 Tax=Daedalea quercina L-15889 TaxID=1314783 RepID=A0A165KXI8_9APHY|nr:hypothetical protein DAEQUDRAFT_741753 [Daedalea quercina L-15889]